MSIKNKFITTAALSFMTLCSNAHAADSSSTTNSTSSANKTLDPNETVKCYGIAKAGQNDCGDASKKHGCAGRSTVDYDPCEWKAVKRKDCIAMKGLETPANCKTAEVMNEVEEKMPEINKK